MYVSFRAGGKVVREVARTQAEDYARSLPQTVRPIFGVLIEALHSLDEKIAVLDREISCRAEEDEDARRLKAIPGVGPVTAAAISALAPDLRERARFRRVAGAHAVARSTGGKQRLSETSKRGERTLRHHGRLLPGAIGRYV